VQSMREREGHGENDYRVIWVPWSGSRRRSRGAVLGYLPLKAFSGASSILAGSGDNVPIN
jgi:hypothetical protein